MKDLEAAQSQMQPDHAADAAGTSGAEPSAASPLYAMLDTLSCGSGDLTIPGSTRQDWAARVFAALSKSEGDAS